MKRTELITKITDMSDNEISDISNYIDKIQEVSSNEVQEESITIGKKEQGGTLNFNGDLVDFEEVNFDTFYEENNN